MACWRTQYGSTSDLIHVLTTQKCSKIPVKAITIFFKFAFWPFFPDTVQKAENNLKFEKFENEEFEINHSKSNTEFNIIESFHLSNSKEEFKTISLEYFKILSPENFRFFKHYIQLFAGKFFFGNRAWRLTFYFKYSIT